MSLKMKSILGGAVLILVLGVILVVLMQEPDTDVSQYDNITSTNNTSTIQDSEKLKLINKDPNDIVSVNVKNSSDEFLIEKLDDEVWGIAELSTFNLVTNYATILKTVAGFTAIEIVEENSSNLSNFGFDEPNIIVDVTFSDNKTYQIKVGEISNQTNTAYVIIDNSPTVYRFFPSTFSDFLLTPKAFISTNIIGALPTYDYGTVDPDYTYMKLERFDLDEPWEFVKYESKTDIMLMLPMYLQFSSPVACDIDAERFPKYFTDYFGLAATSIEAYNPTDEQLIEYGFDKPYATFTTVYGDGEMEFTLIVGNEIPTQGFNSRYIMLDGTDLVYVIGTSSLPFLTVQSSDIISSMLVLETSYGYSNVEVKVAGKTVSIDVWEEDNVIVQNNDGTYGYADGTLCSSINGVNFDSSYYSLYLQNLFLTSAVDITNLRPTGSPDLSIKYTYTDDSVETVDAYAQSDRTTILVLNGTDYFTGRSGYIESVTEQTQSLLDYFG